MPTLITPPLLMGPLGVPGVGVVTVRAIRPFFDVQGNLITGITAKGTIVGGQFYGPGGTPFVIPATPPNETLEIWVKLDSWDGEQTLLETFQQRTVSVANQASVTWADGGGLIDTVPVREYASGDYIVPSVLYELIEARDTILVSTAAAAGSAQDAAESIVEIGELTSTATTAAGDAVVAQRAAELAASNAVAPTDEALTALDADAGSAFRIAQDARQTATFAQAPATARPPTYSGTTLHSWDPSLALYNGESPTMRTIRNLVAKGRAGQQSVRLTCSGDSKTLGAGIGPYPPAIDSRNGSYPGQLRNLLAASEGAIFGCIESNQWSNNTGWVWSTATNRNDLNSATDGSLSTISLILPACTGFSVVLGGPNASGSVDISVDGGTATSYVSGNNTWVTRTVTGLSDAAHTLRFTTTTAVTISQVRPIYPTNRLTISNAGRSSSTPNDWTAAVWVNLWIATYEYLAIRPDIAIINLGTNGEGGLLEAISSVHNLGIPILLVAPAGLTNRNALYQATYSIANTLNLPLLDFRQVVGDYNRANALGLMGDIVHENLGGYAKEAWAVARALSI